MENNNNSYRIKTEVGKDQVVNVKLDQSFDMFEVLSLKLDQSNFYKVETSGYGGIVGRVLANGGFGIPNAKVSIFIQLQKEDKLNPVLSNLYPFLTTYTKDNDGIRYNLLPDDQVNDCHKVVGTFPNKRVVLDNNDVLEMYDGYYQYTTRTNNAGDYMIFGVPVGNQTIHIDLDLSDVGILSQRPRDMVYKGYNINQFENANQFKTDNNLDSLAQIHSQDSNVYVYPFWGDESDGDEVAISRKDIQINYKFEPTCVFMGSVVTDGPSTGMGERCMPISTMGEMDSMRTGAGTMEMIYKTIDGRIEEKQVQGTKVIDGNGVWCYQIPMNLDYVTTDEYGNMVPTDDPTKGIATRAEVRFRLSLDDEGDEYNNFFRSKMLIPNYPKNQQELTETYEFGSNTKDHSFRDLYWNNVYSVKSFIPRIQKWGNFKEKRFTGIKHSNIHGDNNPMPYNNIRIQMPFMFSVICIIIKMIIFIIELVNTIITWIPSRFCFLWVDHEGDFWTERQCMVIPEGFCDEQEGWYYAPGCRNQDFDCESRGWIYGYRNYGYNNLWRSLQEELVTPFIVDIYQRTNGVCDPRKLLRSVKGVRGFEDDPALNTANYNPETECAVKQELMPSEKDGKVSMIPSDPMSLDATNIEPITNGSFFCLTQKKDYLIECVEIQLAQEYKVINFDFYNDWVNGVVYLPQWQKKTKKKRTFLFGLIQTGGYTHACNQFMKEERRYTHYCAPSYKNNNVGGKIDSNTYKNTVFNEITPDIPQGCAKGYSACHKDEGRRTGIVYGSEGGMVHEFTNLKKQRVYYYKPCEFRRDDWYGEGKNRIPMFASDIILLGSLNDCDIYGIPQAYKFLNSTSYQIPPNLAQTNLSQVGYLYGNADSGTKCTTAADPQNGEPKISAMTTVTQSEDSYLKYAQMGNSEKQSNTYITTSDKTGKDRPNGDLVYDPFTKNAGMKVSPLTSLSGMDWGYNGPDQGTEDSDHLFYPGGHFLGISCTNSQTNLKSCVNLTRACEAGAWLSQRQQLPSSGFVNKNLTDVNNPSRIKNFVTIIPSGLISKDELTDSDVRSMFATLNHNQLKTKLDPKTGRKVYDFRYFYPNNFEGALRNKINGEGSPYKTLNLPNRAVLEYNDNDYYRYRMGDLNHFITKDDGGNVSLPSYENSFYFYFGLKPGNTAIDIFNKEYFAVCNTNQEEELTISVNIEQPTSCSKLKGTITATVSNAELPLKYQLFINGGDQAIAEGKSNTNVIVFKDLNDGQYTVSIFDKNGTGKGGRTEVTIATNKVECDFKKVDFIKDYTITDMEGKACEIRNDVFNNNSTTGGYLLISNFVWGEEAIPIASLDTNLLIIVSKEENGIPIEYMCNKGNIAGRLNDDLYGFSFGSYLTCGDPLLYKVHGAETIMVGIWEPDAVYKVYIFKLCNNRAVVNGYFNITNLVSAYKELQLSINGKIDTKILERFKTGFGGESLYGWNALSDLSVYDFPKKYNDADKKAFAYAMKKTFYLDGAKDFTIKGMYGIGPYRVRTQYQGENTEGMLLPAEFREDGVYKTVKTPTLVVDNNGNYVYKTQNTISSIKQPYFGVVKSKNGAADGVIKPVSAETVFDLNDTASPEINKWFGAHLIDKTFKVNMFVWKATEEQYDLACPKFGGLINGAIINGVTVDGLLNSTTKVKTGEDSNIIAYTSQGSDDKPIVERPIRYIRSYNLEAFKSIGYTFEEALLPPSKIFPLTSFKPKLITGEIRDFVFRRDDDVRMVNKTDKAYDILIENVDGNVEYFVFKLNDPLFPFPFLKDADGKYKSGRLGPNTNIFSDKVTIGGRKEWVTNKLLKEHCLTSIADTAGSRKVTGLELKTDYYIVVSTVDVADVNNHINIRSISSPFNSEDKYTYPGKVEETGEISNKAGDVIPPATDDCGAAWYSLNYYREKVEYWSVGIDKRYPVFDYIGYRGGRQHRKERIDGQCGWVAVAKVTHEATGGLCGANGSDGYTCNGTGDTKYPPYYSIYYNQMKKTTKYMYPDDETQKGETVIEYYAGTFNKAEDVSGQCNEHRAPIEIYLDITDVVRDPNNDRNTILSFDTRDQVHRQMFDEMYQSGIKRPQFHITLTSMFTPTSGYGTYSLGELWSLRYSDNGYDVVNAKLKWIGEEWTTETVFTYKGYNYKVILGNRYGFYDGSYSLTMGYLYACNDTVSLDWTDIKYGNFTIFNPVKYETYDYQGGKPGDSELVVGSLALDPNQEDGGQKLHEWLTGPLTNNGTIRYNMIWSKLPYGHDVIDFNVMFKYEGSMGPESETVQWAVVDGLVCNVGALFHAISVDRDTMCEQPPSN